MKIIFTENQKARLDVFMTKQIGITRSKIQKQIKKGKIKVNGELPMVHHWLKNGDEIEFVQKELKEVGKKKKFEPNPDVKFKVVFEDDDILIIDKPAGLIIHPTEHMEPDTLANGLIAKYPEIKKVGDDPVRPGIVHRLDRKVSGLLLVCKTQKAFEYYKNLFTTRDIKKTYTALVHGVMEQSSGTINFPISRSSTKAGRMAAHPEETEIESKDAVTHYEVVTQFPHLALLKVNIETGRTHQIRVHMQAIQHPIVGDSLYSIKTVKQKVDLDRVFLHATELEFVNRHGVAMKFKSPLPKDLKTFLDSLNK